MLNSDGRIDWRQTYLGDACTTGCRTMLPIDQRVILIVGLTVAVIFIVIAARVLTGRKWRNRLPLIDKPNNQRILAFMSSTA